MSDAPQVLTIPQVAATLGLTTAAFYKRHHKLREQHGVPPPLPGLGHRWDPAAIAAWIGRQGNPTAAETPPPANDIDVWQQRLDERAARLAGRA
jgi:predicted DNA-binding transcriptional regulator AlpA